MLAKSTSIAEQNASCEDCMKTMLHYSPDLDAKCALARLRCKDIQIFVSARPTGEDGTRLYRPSGWFYSETYRESYEGQHNSCATSLARFFSPPFQKMTFSNDDVPTCRPYRP